MAKQRKLKIFLGALFLSGLFLFSSPTLVGAQTYEVSPGQDQGYVDAILGATSGLQAQYGPYHIQFDGVPGTSCEFSVLFREYVTPQVCNRVKNQLENAAQDYRDMQQVRYQDFYISSQVGSGNP